MAKNIITISREYGSGGRKIGMLVAERLGIPYYDSELIDAAAEEVDFPPEMIADREQRLTRSVLYNFAVGAVYGISYPKPPKTERLPLAEQIFLAQKKAIEQAADRGPCVIIGRCADAILKDRPDILRVFIYADMESRKKRAVEEYGDIEEQVDVQIRKNDKHRRIHYENYANMEWGGRESHDLLINSGVFGIEGCVDLICRASQE